MKPSNQLVQARGLTKLFSGKTAVDNIDFDIKAGEVVGFLGPNGAGKTTTIRMLLNLLNPSAGDLSIFGLNYNEHRAQILRQMNASSGSISLPGKLSVQENLRVFADLYGISHVEKRIDELVEKFELKNLFKRPLFSLSTGQQVRVALAKAFLNQPRLLLLDEPTASLDPDVADRVRSYLMDVVKNEKTTVFLTSHNMREVEEVCTRVLFLNNGKIQAEGTPKELARRVKRWRLLIKTNPPLKELPGVHCPKDAELTFEPNEVCAEMDKDEIGPFITELIQKGVKIESLATHEPTLEDFFVHTARIPPHEVGRLGGD